ncbi:MAG: flagellar biosynthesis anti-sigma factor FlgM [Deltaproteobacteria bacterium]|nr:flagellar biosynthesis anti-sigma factor FlgM [Deltaproteobacteria bacterium]
MKVDETYQSANLIDQAREAGAGRKNEEQGAQVGNAWKQEKHGGGTEVALSNASRDIMKAGEAMETPDPKRTERVAELKKQVAEGTYEVDSKKVADRILGTALSELL